MNWLESYIYSDGRLECKVNVWTTEDHFIANAVSFPETGIDAVCAEWAFSTRVAGSARDAARNAIDQLRSALYATA